MRRREHRLRRCLGEELPVKFGNVRISRIVNGQERDCSFCFPHGLETSNASWRKRRRSWKYHRRHQYRAVVKRTRPCYRMSSLQGGRSHVKTRRDTQGP